MMRSREDRLFAHFCRTGDPRALAKVFDRTAGELWHVAAYLCRDRHEAEDLVQATYLAAIEDRAAYVPGRPVLPWLLGILVNRAREARRRAARVPDATRLERAPEPDPAAAAHAAEFGAAFGAALVRLPAPFRETLEAHLVRGRTPHEIAAALGVAAGTVRMRLHRGLTRLRRLLPRGFALGAVGVAMPDAAFAAIREVVLTAVRAAPAPPVAAASTTLALLGGLAVKKTLLVVALLVAALALWAALPPLLPHPEPAPVALEVARHGDAPRQAAGDTAGPGPRAEVPAAGRAPAPSASAGSGVLRVVVRNAASLEGMQGLHLEAWGRTLAYGTTDAHGGATFRLAPGRVEVRAPYLDAWVPLRGEVVAGRETLLECALAPRTLVDVTVVDADATPVAGALVVGRGHGTDDLEQRVLGRTDLEGRWRGSFVERGVALRALAEGRVASPQRGVDGRGLTAVQVRLEVGGPAATLTGEVIDAEGRGVTGARVAVQPRSERPWREVPLFVATDRDGRFRAEHLPEGGCQLVAWTGADSGLPRFATALADARRDAGGRVTLRFSAGGRIAGTLRAAGGTPYAGAQVVAACRPMEFWPGLATVLTRSTQSAADGSFALDGLAPGSYRMQARADERECVATLEVAEGQTLRWDPDLADGLDLAVRLVDGRGRPLEGWTIRCTLPGANAREATTGTGGDAGVRGLQAGAWTVSASAPGAHFPSVVRREVRPGAEQLLLLVTDEALPTAGLHGTLTLHAGVTVAELTVELLHEQVSTPLRVDPGTLAFALRSLVPGRYLLLIRHGTAVLRTVGPIHVGPEQDLDLGGIHVRPPGSLTLEVQRSDGSAPHDVFALAAAGGARPWRRIPQEPCAGGLRLPGLPPAEFEVLVWGSDVQPRSVPVRTLGGDAQTLPVILAPAVPCEVRFRPGEPAALRGVLSIRTHGGAVLVEEEVRLAAGESCRRGLAPGTYTIEFTAADGRRGAGTLEVGERSAAPLELTLRRP
ncbi:MAG: sigma-70 family RNA polymerase sigma factor [Planctomycetes bacterium]|nr:sigma-70 family RNA polymerase sigma factor [Planctomycetota bacterium]